MTDISLIRSGKPLSFGQQLKLTAMLSWPAMMAQLSSIMMQYIDAAMVGRLGADDSAAVGLVSTSLWLCWGVCSMVTMGFSVQVAHSVGAGNMKVPGALNVMMCVLDVLFNFLLIFPSRDVTLLGVGIHIPGAGLGVLGAALGTVSAEALTAGAMMFYLLRIQPDLRLRGTTGSFRPTRQVLGKALRISAPMTLEHAVICGAQIAVTVIVAPLGNFAIAANAFAVTAESLCYMPGYGIADAATTLVGQSYGAGRKDLARRFGYITTALGMTVMTVMGVVLYILAPAVMQLMSPVGEIVTLGASALRIEAFAEPMFAAAIVAYGVMVGVGDTILPACMNFGSIWLVRLPLAAILAPTMGLDGVWLAMCIELTFRGAIFLWRLLSGAWLRKGI